MYDVISQPRSVRTYKQDFLLWTQQWDRYTDPLIPLDWQCVKFERDNASLVPTEKGIYAFFIEPRIAQFPSHGYLMYIGQTGHNSERNLRKRFRDYLYDKNLSKRKLLKSPSRAHIHDLLNTWAGYLYFYYAEVDTTQTNLRQLERQLLDTFIPPFVDRGYSAKIGKIIPVVRR